MDDPTKTARLISRIKATHPHLANIFDCIVHLLQKYPTETDIGHYELEARLGVYDSDTRSFVSDVSREIFLHTIERLDKFGGWLSKSTTVSRDYYYALPPSKMDLVTDSTLLRTSVEESGGLLYTQHMCKQSHAKYTFRSRSLTGRAEPPKLDVRITLNLEESVPPEQVPDVVRETVHVRIKERTSYTVGSSATGDMPMWRFDITQSWNGRNLLEVDQKRYSATCNKDCQYEIELEFLRPRELVAQCGVLRAALSWLLKINDLIGADPSGADKVVWNSC